MGTITQQLTFYGSIILALILFFGICAIIMWYFLVYKRRRRWKVEIHEQKKDGRVHSVGKDTLEERQKSWGTKTFYYLKGRKKVALPPPDIVVDRLANGREEVDYLQIERQLFPAMRELKVNYHDPKINKLVTNAYDKLITSMASIKTTLFNTESIKDRFIYIPINKTLTANMQFKPIPYDVQLTAQRQVEMHNEFFKKKGTFWEKWGGVVLLLVVAIILLLVVYLSYDFVNEQITKTLGKVGEVVNPLTDIVDKLGGKPPS